jgi:choline kinase
MKGLILAAGRGSRMGSATSEKPKCLAEVQGRTLLEWQLTAMTEAGIKDIAIVTGYKSDLLSGKNLRSFHNNRWQETNMVSSLLCASKWLQSDSCVISYADIFYSKQALETLISDNSDLSITHDPNWEKLWTERFGDPLLDAETFKLNSDNTIKEIGKKPKSLEDVNGQYMGLLKFTKKGFNQLLEICYSLDPKDLDKLHMTGLLQKAIQKREISIKALAYLGTWGEVDSIDDLNYYNSQ